MINDFKNSLLQIRPRDTIFCREGFSFKKGYSNWIESLKKPYPSVFYGASVSCLMRRGYFIDLLKEKTTIEMYLKQKLNIKGIYIYDEYTDKVWIKAPKDLFLTDNEARVGEYREGTIWNPEEFYDNSDSYWISTDDFLNKYVKGEAIRKRNLIDNSDLYLNNEKTGIEIDRFNKTANEGNIYNITMVGFRNHNLSYLLNIDHKNLFDNRFKDNILLGGE